MAPNLLPTPTGSEGAIVATKGIVVTKGTELLMSILEAGGSRDESGTWPLVGEVAEATMGYQGSRHVRVSDIPIYNIQVSFKYVKWVI